MHASAPTLRILLLSTLLAGLAHADVIVLRNLVVEGKIVAEDEKTIEIDTTSGEHVKYRLSKVVEIVRGVDAEDYFRGLVAKLGEDDADGRARNGFLASRSGQQELAREFYLEAIALDPTNTTAGRGLGYALIDGKWVEPEERAPTSSSPDTASEGKPTVYLDVQETIDDLPWQDFLLRFPNPKYTESVGSQLGGTMFPHDHGWRLIAQADAARADFVAKLVLEARQTRTTDWMTQRMQVFYEATISIELTRKKDGARVLWAQCAVERGHHDEGSAARNAFLRAASTLVKDKQIVDHPLWADPEGTPAMKKQIIVKEATEKGASGKGD